jgi:hypothetical protein
MDPASTRTARITLVKENFIRMTMLEDVMLELQDMKDNHAMENKVAGGKPHVILIDTRSNSVSSDEARKFTSGHEPTRYRIAMAILFKGLAGRIGANSLIKKYTPKVLTRAFDDEAKAMEWLDKQLAEYHNFLRH